MTHEETRRLWREMDWKKSPQEIAKETGRSLATVHFYRREAAWQDSEPPEWVAKADWSFCDAEVARQTGGKYMIVRKWRIRHHIPPSKKGKHQTKFDQFDHGRIDFTKTDMVNAEQIGVSRERIRQLRKLAGLPSSKTLHRPPKWTEAADWALSSSAIAGRVGCSESTVCVWRRRMGVGKWKRPTTFPHHEIDWSRSTAEVSNLTGYHPVHVSNLRRKYAPETLFHHVQRPAKCPRVDWSRSAEEIGRVLDVKPKTANAWRQRFGKAHLRKRDWGRGKKSPPQKTRPLSRPGSVPS